MADTGMKPNVRAYAAAQSTFHHLGPEYPPEQRLEKAVEAAFAQHSADRPSQWPSVVIMLILAATFLATLQILK